MATVKQQSNNVTVDFRTVNEYTRMIDLAFKKLLAKQYSDPFKNYYEEGSISPFTLNAKDVWTDNIPSDPLTALKTHNLDDHSVVEGVIRRRTNPDTGLEEEYAEGMTYKLTKVLDTKSPYAYYIYEDDTQKNANGDIISPRYTGFVSDLYGSGYIAKLYVGTKEIPTGDYGWLFDYATGTMTLTSPLPAGDVTLKAYRYIGRTVKESIGETYDEDLGNLIIQPNKTINWRRDTGQTTQS